MDLFELNRNLQGFDIREEIVEVIRETTGDIVKFNQDQLGLGLLADGKEIKNLKTRSYFYSRGWSLYRQSLGLQVEYFDLNVTGAFWRSINVSELTVTSFKIEASDSKAPEIIDMFGEEVLGLNDESRQLYTHQVFYPVLRGRIQRKIGI